MKPKTPVPEIVLTLQLAHNALTECIKHLMQRGPAPDPSLMAAASGAVSRALLAEKARAETPADAQLARALSACRSIRFAVVNSSRHGGEFSLNDLLAADLLAREALGLTAPAAEKAKPASKKKGGGK
jgi:hypothetical protein